MNRSTRPQKGKRARELAPANTIGARVRAQRVVKLLTQADLAKVAGITVQSISDLERGNSKTFKPENLIPIADLLGVNARWLVTGKGTMAPRGDISEEEKHLLEIFRHLDDRGRSEIVGYARAVLHRMPEPSIADPFKVSVP